MRTLYTVAGGLTLMILAYILRKPALRLAFNRDTPETPTDWAPKMRTWKNGVLQ